MGIVAVIARAKKSVQMGGLPGVVEEFGGTLRSRAIPAPLRPAAKRIADLLRVPKPASKKPVSLVDERSYATPHAVDGFAHQEGVCPFTGTSAASSDVPEVQAAEAVSVEAVTVEAVLASPAEALSATAVAADLSEDLSATAVAADLSEETTVVDRIVLEMAAEAAAVVAAVEETPVEEILAAVETPVVEVAHVAPAVVAAEPSEVAKAKIKDEKVTVEVAAKANTAKTSPRSNKNSGGKSGNKKKK